MKQDFLNINYLKTGSEKQQKAYNLLIELEIFENLQAYQPIITGTIPIGIDLPGSDLDVICQCYNHKEFEETIAGVYSNEIDFKIKTRFWNGQMSTIASFEARGFYIEIFGQNVPTQMQDAYKHMVIEYKILNKLGPEFKSAVVGLKKKGMKTEPAFAKLLDLKGDPYEALKFFRVEDL